MSVSALEHIFASVKFLILSFKLRRGLETEAGGKGGGKTISEPLLELEAMYPWHCVKSVRLYLIIVLLIYSTFVWSIALACK